MEKRLLRVLMLLPIWLFAVAMLMALLGGTLKEELGANWRLVTYGLPFLLFLAYFPAARWIYRWKGVRA